MINSSPPLSPPSSDSSMAEATNKRPRNGVIEVASKKMRPGTEGKAPEDLMKSDGWAHVVEKISEEISIL